MMLFHRITLALLFVTAACCSLAQAQPGAPPAAPAPAAPAAATPATAPAEPPSPALETNPTVRAALEIERKTPADHFQAIIWLIELGRPELAKPILEELSKLQLSDEQRAALVLEFGSRDMLLLAQSKELAPAGLQFSDACMKAAAAETTDPKRIATLIAQLSAPSAEARLIARNDLAAIGQPGVNAALEALAKEPDPRRRAAIASAVSQMQPLVVGPLLAMLETPDPQLRSDVTSILEKLVVPQAAPLLPRSIHDAEQSLTAALRNYRRGMLPFAADENNQIELWRWDDATKKLAAARFPVDEARIIWMARLARNLTHYVPDNDVYAKQALALELEAAALTGNANSPAVAELQSADLGLLNRLLADSLTSNYTHAAIAAINAIAERGISDLVYSSGATPAPLADALQHRSRRVRFAALRAIMKVDPQSPYPGSSRVPEALAWFAGSTGERRAVVAMSTAVAATNLAGMMAVEGLQATATDSGREAVDLALAMPDLEMILVDANINGPGIRQVVYELRISPTTAEIPIAILAPNSRLATAQQIASEHTRVIASPRIQTPEVLQRVVAQLAALSGRFATPPNTRAAEAVQALTWLSMLADGNRPFYKIRRSEPVIEAALYNPDSATPAIIALAKLGTADSQTALVNFASQPTLPLDSRAAAADGFRDSVAKHGVLLTTDQIYTQYDRYNASETADAGTQRVLGAVLDAIESRRPSAPAPSPQPPALDQ
jgi:HEAT repeat protein